MTLGGWAQIRALPAVAGGAARRDRHDARRSPRDPAGLGGGAARAARRRDRGGLGGPRRPPMPRADAPTPDLVVDTILQEAAERATSARSPRSRLRRRPRRRRHGRRCRPPSASTSARRCSAARWRPSTRGSDARASRASSGCRSAHRGFASDVEELRLPVLLNPAVSSRAGGPEDAEADQAARFGRRARRAPGAASSWRPSPPSPSSRRAGPLYAGKLLRDALGLERAAAPDEPAPRLDPALALEARVAMAGRSCGPCR